MTNTNTYKFSPSFFYRQLFVTFERETDSTIAYMYNDRNYCGSFISAAETQKEFEEECHRYLEKKKEGEKVCS